LVGLTVEKANEVVTSAAVARQSGAPAATMRPQKWHDRVALGSLVSVFNTTCNYLATAFLKTDLWKRTEIRLLMGTLAKGFRRGSPLHT